MFETKLQDKWTKEHERSKNCLLNMFYCQDSEVSLCVRSHINWRGEQCIPYKGVETSP